MRYHVLATDYDGTLARDGVVDADTLAALERLRGSGRKLVMVTGRELDDLLRVFPSPHIDLFDLIVAENGALLYDPRTRSSRLLADPPPGAFVETLKARGVGPISVGRAIVATWQPHETTVLEVIRDLGLELQVIFNKEAVMVLPSGVNKATGLAVALTELGLSPHNAVGIGDAENDHAFLASCECAVAVENALPMLKQRADLVTNGARGAGVTELIDRLIDNDLKDLSDRLTRYDISVGHGELGDDVRLPAYGVTVLLAGTSGGGKSTFASGLVERISDKGYQYCIIDPEGDYSDFDGAVVLGDKQRAPSVAEAIDLLGRAEQNAVLNLLGIPLEHRPRFFDELMPQLQSMRARTGRPHWIVIDETHHLLPTGWDPGDLTTSPALHNLLLITVHPEHVSPALLTSVDVIFAIGKAPNETIANFAKALGEEPPPTPVHSLQPGESIAWWRRPLHEPFWVRSIPPRAERRRHIRKYVEGELSVEESFYFRGPENRLNLRVQNLNLFLQIAEGIDDGTWQFHLQRGDYSDWFRRCIKDPDLADEASAVERGKLPPAETRAAIRAMIQERYTAPA